MKKAYEEILTAIGEDVTRQGLVDTPERAAKAMQYLTRGYQEKLEDIVNDALFDSTMSEMVIVKRIEFYSLCEHHLLPFFGHCDIGYIPNGAVIGLSKIPRIVNYFASRLQIQEQLTTQIAEEIASVTGALGVGVVVTAKHLCVMMRGIEKQLPEMVTSVMLGSLREESKSRLEFLQLIK